MKKIINRIMELIKSTNKNSVIGILDYNHNDNEVLIFNDDDITMIVVDPTNYRRLVNEYSSNISSWEPKFELPDNNGYSGYNEIFINQLFQGIKLEDD